MDIPSLKQQFDSELAAAANEADLRAIRDRYLSRKNGLVSAFMKTLGAAAPEQRAALGQAANEFKAYVETGLDARLAASAAKRAAGDAIDVSLPGPSAARRPSPSADAAARARRVDLLALRLLYRRGARARGRLPQLRSAQHAAGAPRARHAGHALPGVIHSCERGPSSDAAADAHVRDADPVHGNAPGRPFG
jgi:hypothetical protein